MTVQESIATAIAREVEWQQPQRSREPRNYVWASEWHPCVRNLWLKMTAAESMSTYDVETRARFLRGSQREADVRHLIEMAGRYADPPFEVEGTQERIEILGRSGKKVITGKKDFNIILAGQVIPAEVKSWPEMHKRVFSVDDLANSPWTRGAEMQILAYLYARNMPLGLLVLDTPTLPRLIEVRLEDRLPVMERFLSDAEAAVEAVGTGIAPPFIADPAECRRCSFFGRSCAPPLDYGPGAAILTDEVLIQRLERRQELKAARDEYEGLDRQVKDSLRGVEQGIAGEFLITGKATKRKGFTVPESEGWTVKIVPLNNGETE